MPAGNTRPFGHQGLVDDDGQAGGGHPGFADTLAGLYAFGLSDNPDVDNLLVGSAFNLFFANDGTLVSAQTGASGASNVNLTRRTTSQGQTLNLLTLNMKNDFPLALTTSGGTEVDHFVSNQSTSNLFDQSQWNLAAPVARNWYSPQIVNGNPLTYFREIMQDVVGGGHTSQWYHNSDGETWQQGRFPNSGGPFKLPAFQLSFETNSNGTPENGSMYGLRWTGPALDVVYASNPEVCSIWGVLDSQNFGSAQAGGHVEVFASGPLVSSGPVMAAKIEATKTTFPGDVQADTLNGGNAYVSGVTGTINFLTTGTYTLSVPTRSGKRFLAWVSRVILDSLTGTATGNLTGKAGNNGSHDNWLTSQTFVTGTALNNVAAGGTLPGYSAGPSTGYMPDMTSTQITVEITGALGGASVATGRFIVSGVYV